MQAKPPKPGLGMIGKSPNSHFYKKVRVLNQTSLHMTISITNKCARRIVMLYSNASISLVLKHRFFSSHHAHFAASAVQSSLAFLFDFTLVSW